MEDKAPNRFWLARWAKKEAFWEALVAQTGATILAALLIGVFLSIAGIGDYAPAVRYYTSQAVLMILTLAVLVAIFLGLMKIFRYRIHRRIAGIWTWILIGVGVVGSYLLTALFVIEVLGGPVREALQEWYHYP